MGNETASGTEQRPLTLRGSPLRRAICVYGEKGGTMTNKYLTTWRAEVENGYEWVSSVPRNPDGTAMEHVGGG
jgi:hypothetical protein